MMTRPQADIGIKGAFIVGIGKAGGCDPQTHTQTLARTNLSIITHTHTHLRTK